MRILFLTGLFASLAFSAATPRNVEISIKKEGTVTYWMPAEVKVKPGETIKVIATYPKSDEGSFKFHGLYIPELNIQGEVHLDKTFTVVKEVPKDLKPGRYQVGCHLHPTHKPATLVVEDTKVVN